MKRKPKPNRGRSTNAITGVERALEALGWVRLAQLRDDELPVLYKVIQTLRDLRDAIRLRNEKAPLERPAPRLRLVMGGAS